MTNELKIDSEAQELLNNIASGVGGSVWWRHHGTRITPEDLRERLTLAGMDADIIPDINLVTALKRQVRDFKATESITIPNGVDKNGDPAFREVRKRVRAEVISKSDSELVIAILFHTQSSRRVAGKDQRDTLVWDLLINDWKEKGATKYADKLRNNIAVHQTMMTGHHIRELVVIPTLRECGGFSAIPGWYYVPTDATDKLAQLQKVVEGIDTFRFSVAAMPQGMGWEGPLGEDAKANLTDDLQALADQIQGWTTMTRKVRQDTRQHVLARFDELHTRAESYEASLSVTLDDLRDQIGEMREKAEEVIEGLDKDLDVARDTAKKNAEVDSTPVEEEEVVVQAATVPVPATVAEEGMSDEEADKLWEVFFAAAPPSDRTEMKRQLEAVL